MTIGLFVLFKMILTFGVLLGFCGWQVWLLHRQGVGRGEHSGLSTLARHAEGQHGADDGRAEARER